MKTIEEAGIDYLNQDLDILDGEYTSCGIVNAFEAGAKFAQRWIDTDDELPVNDDLQLVINTRGEFLLASYSKYHERWMGDYFAIIDVTNWRPIEL